MAKYKYILTVIITLCTLITYAQPAQYTPMTAAGYQMKRLKVDSTLHLPSFCGVPTLRGSSAKEGALAIDTCGGFLFIWTTQNGWDTIGGSGGGGSSTDTTSLSNRINLKVDSIRRVSDSVFAWINGVKFFQFKDSVGGGGGGIGGSGTQYFVPKWSASTTLENSQIFDSVNVGINTTSPAYKLDVNGNGRFTNDLFADEDFIVNNYFTINTTATTFPLPDNDLGIWRKKDNLSGTKFIEDEQGATKDKWAFVQRAGYGQTREWFQTNSSIVNINYGWGNPNSSNYEGNTLLINPTIRLGSALNSNTKIRGIYYNPTLDSLVNTTHIAFESTSGNVVMKGLKTSNSTTDSIAIWINDTLSKAPYPSGAGGASDTIYTQNPIMYITRNDSNIIYFNADTANVWRSSGIDSLKRSSDSVYARKNGNFIFQFKDSVGGGSGSDTSKVVIAQVHNATATTLLKGEVVYLFGSTGNVASVKRANNKTDATSSKTFGIVRRDIPAGGTGFITTQGQIEKLNLGSYTEGDVLWLDSIDGQFTKVKPQAPYHGVFLGIVERANNGNGLAYIKVQNGYELGEIHDVKLTSPINNQVLAYSDTQLVWKNRNITSLIDTTLFQRKSLSANTIMANNTNATANATAQIFKQFGNQTYSDSITITGASNPSGTINHSYRWSQIGNLVTLHITLTYATAGSLSQVAIEIPDGLPAPILPTGLTANNDIISYGTGFMTTNTTAVAILFSKVFLRQNTGLTNDYEVVINQASNSTYRIFNATIQYFAQ